MAIYGKNTKSGSKGKVNALWTDEAEKVVRRKKKVILVEQVEDVTEDKISKN